MALAGGERAEQVEAGDAAARAAAAPLGVERDQDHGPAVALDDPRGDDPDDARMPALAGKHQPGRLAEPVGQLAAGSLGRREHLALDLAALAVCPLELGGDLGCPRLVVGEHQLDAGVGAVQAPGGVDPRCEPEREIALVEPLGLDPGDAHQRPQPGPRGAARLGEPAPDQGPVLAAQRRPGRRPSPARRGRARGVGRLGAVAARSRACRRRRSRRDRRTGSRETTGWRIGQSGSSGAGLVVVGDDHLDARRARRRDLLDRSRSRSRP